MASPRFGIRSVTKTPAEQDFQQFQNTLAAKPAPVKEMAPQDTSAGYSHFEKMRQRAKQQGLANKQTQGEALKRRFAAIGNLGGGAYIKAAGQQDQAADAQTQAAIEDVDMAEQGQRYQEQQAERGRQFQASESEKTRNLQESLSAKDMAFRTMVFKDEQRFREIDAAATASANRLNAVTAIGELDDEQLRSISGYDFQRGFLGRGGKGTRDEAISAALKRLGYA